MTMDEAELALHGYIERMAMVLEAMGMSRMDGRVMVYLLVCTPAEQSLTQIAKALGISKGAASLSTRALLRVGMIDGVPRRGSRSAWFRLRPTAWAEILRAKMAGMAHMRSMADEGLALIAHHAPEDRERLAAFRDLYAHFETKMPELIDAWLASRQPAGATLPEVP